MKHHHRGLRSRKNALINKLDEMQHERWLKRPPSSERFCVLCNQMRPFKYNPLKHHSECTVCEASIAFRRAPPAKPKPVVPKPVEPPKPTELVLRCFSCEKKTPHKRLEGAGNTMCCAVCGAKRRK